jgi:hypothetical protein
MLRRFAVGIVLAIFSSAALAVDPLTLILLRMLRSQIITNAAENVYERLTAPEQPTVIVPGPAFDSGDAELRTLIDEGFLHLSRSQREEVFVSVKRILDDPKHAALRGDIFEELRVKASAVRQAHDHLSKLPRQDKRLLVAEVRDEYRKLEAEDRRQMLAALESGVVPIPRELNDMILEELRSVQR